MSQVRSSRPKQKVKCLLLMKKRSIVDLLGVDAHAVFEMLQHDDDPFHAFRETLRFKVFSEILVQECVNLGCCWPGSETKFDKNLWKRGELHHVAVTKL